MQIGHSLIVVDGHRVEVNPNSRVLRSIVSEEAHASPKSGVIKFLWERASFAAQTQSFLCGKFFTARLEVLPHSRHGGVFQKSTMVNFGIGLKRRWARWVQAYFGWAKACSDRYDEAAIFDFMTEEDWGE